MTTKERDLLSFKQRFGGGMPYFRPLPVWGGGRSSRKKREKKKRSVNKFGGKNREGNEMRGGYRGGSGG